MSEAKKTILFTIELSHRELIGKCLLALEMARLGFRVYIGTFRSIHEIRRHLDSCIFFHKSAYKRRVKQYKRQMGAVIAIMDEEAGIAIPKRMIGEFCEHRYKTLEKTGYDYVFTIGDVYTTKMREMPNMEGIHIVTSGWPRIDLWREEYSAMHKQKTNDIKSRYGDYWLFVSSFGMTNQAALDYHLRIAQFEDEKIRAKNTFVALQNYIDLLKNLASDKDRKIIFRPHTSESLDEWKAIFSDHPNIIINREGDITPWLLATTGVITYRSTVNVQAALNGIPTVQYKINEIDGLDDLAVFKVSRCAESVDEVRDYLNSFKGQEERDRLKNMAIAALAEDVASLQGETAARKIAKTLDTVNIQPQPAIKVGPLAQALSYAWDRYKYLEYRLRKVIFREVSGYRISRFEKIPNGIKSDEISAILHLLQSIESGSQRPVICKQASNNLVMIE